MCDKCRRIYAPLTLTPEEEAQLRNSEPRTYVPQLSSGDVPSFLTHLLCSLLLPAKVRSPLSPSANADTAVAAAAAAAAASER